MQRSKSNAERGLFWPVLCLIAAVDFGTKYLAAHAAAAAGTAARSVRRLGAVHAGAQSGRGVRAASSGSQSRWIFMALTIVALVILGFLYTCHAARRRAAHRSRSRWSAAAPSAI